MHLLLPCGSARDLVSARARVLERKWHRADALGGEPVLVDQPAEQVAVAYAIEVDHVGEWLLRLQRRPLPECPVRSMLVEMADVCDEHVLEVAAAEDQQSVEAL